MFFDWWESWAWLATFESRPKQFPRALILHNLRDCCKASYFHIYLMTLFFFKCFWVCKCFRTEIMPLFLFAQALILIVQILRSWDAWLTMNARKNGWVCFLGQHLITTLSWICTTMISDRPIRTSQKRHCITDVPRSCMLQKTKPNIQEQHFLLEEQMA